MAELKIEMDEETYEFLKWWADEYGGGSPVELLEDFFKGTVAGCVTGDYSQIEVHRPESSYVEIPEKFRPVAKRLVESCGSVGTWQRR